MSTDYYVVCQDCDVLFQTIEDSLHHEWVCKDLVADAAALALIAEAVRTVKADIRIELDYCGVDNLQFFLDHKGHHLVILDEYSLPDDVKYGTEEDPEPETAQVVYVQPEPSFRAKVSAALVDWSCIFFLNLAGSFTVVLMLSTVGIPWYAQIPYGPVGYSVGSFLLRVFNIPSRWF